MDGICPHCKKAVQRLHFGAVEGGVPLGDSFRCITLCCPHCKTVLSAQVDPVAIRTDILRAIKGGR